MSDLKKAWKKTAKSAVLALNDLGIAIADSAKVGYDAVIAWANSDDNDEEILKEAEAAKANAEEKAE